MNIYVDPLYPTPQTNRWSRTKAAHLFCLPGGDEVLRQFGKLMGIPEDRYRPIDVVPHWELTEEEHEVAIAAGAKPVTRAGMEEAVRIWRAHRAAEPQDGRKRRGKKK